MVDTRRSRAQVAALMLVVSAAVTTVIAEHRAVGNRRIAHRHFDEQVTRLADRLVARMQVYEYGLRGTRGVMMAIGEGRFDRKLFRAYHESRDIDREFPGAHGYGFIRRVPPGEDAAFVAAAQRDSAPDYAIWQFEPHDGERDAILYVEPVERNHQALGADIASESHRRAAVQQSVALGAAALTAPITLRQATAFPGRAFLLMLPVFRRGMPIATTTERDAAVYGWAFAPLAIDEVLKDFELRDDAIALRLEDVTPESPGGPFLTAAGFEAAGVDGLATANERPVYGRLWRIEARARPRFIDELNLLAPVDVLAIGGVASLLMAALAHAFLLAVHRARQVRHTRPG